ncbi:uncharacterized protein LOC129613976 [Condylostylus longicornis]|uniref:uncharacterized protein LOC129613976 n=1 Tax=Condylostylus longicornis TaxID=2530218 RepID=UPI00244DF005|nr:uncharacterized protein LOC129613976 [Condylostylus longicornis]
MSSSTSNNIKIRLATKDDHDLILDCFRKWYWPEEPLSVGFQIKTPSFVEEETFSSIPEKGLSLIAFETKNNENNLNDDNGAGGGNNQTNDDSNNEIPIGFLVNGLSYPNLGLELHNKFKDLGCKRMMALLNLIDVIDKKEDIFKKFSTEKTFNLISVAVSPEYRGKNIGYRLFERAFQMAKTLGFKIANVDCSSYYSAKIAEKCKMQLIAEIAYTEHKDSDGNQIFKPPPPHTHMKRYAKIL